jgi:hypothetical protein
MRLPISRKQRSAHVTLLRNGASWRRIHAVMDAAQPYTIRGITCRFWLASRTLTEYLLLSNRTRQIFETETGTLHCLAVSRLRLPIR